jgi:hypothetical protein
VVEVWSRFVRLACVRKVEREVCGGSVVVDEEAARVVIRVLGILCARIEEGMRQLGRSCGVVTSLRAVRRVRVRRSIDVEVVGWEVVEVEVVRSVVWYV